VTRKPTKPRVIVVSKRSNLSRLRDGLLDQRAERLFKAEHETVNKWGPAHEDHERSLDLVIESLEKFGASVLLLRGASASFDPKGAQLVVTVGGDGTLLAASHSVGETPILAINSAPRFSVGFFCAARPESAHAMLERALEGKLAPVRLSRMQVIVAGQIRAKRVLNEALYCHHEPAATSNYILRIGRLKEEQKSSGIWVGPAAGSTAAIRSAGGIVLPLSSSNLQLVVREPYVARGKDYRLIHKVFGPKSEVSVVSKMDLARIYLDGPYRALDVRLGDEVRFLASDEPLTVLGLKKQRQTL
jgi:NAD+ kinase